MNKTILSSLLAFELLVGEGHFEEVKSEEFHEEKYSKEGWKYPSNIGQDVQELEISAINIFSDGGPLDPKVSGGGGRKSNLSPFFKRLVAQAILGRDLGIGKKASIG